MFVLETKETAACVNSNHDNVDKRFNTLCLKMFTHTLNNVVIQYHVAVRRTQIKLTAKSFQQKKYEEEE